MFDETTERLALELHTGLLPQVQRSALHILVSRQELRWSMALPNGFRRFLWEGLRPPVTLLSTDGEAIFDGLVHVPIAAPFQQAFAASVARADVGIQHMDRDGATANDKAICMIMAENKSALTSHQVCGNHQSNLCEAGVVVAVGGELLPKLACISHLFRMGGNFLKLIHSTADFVHKYLRKYMGAPPDGAHRFVSVVLDYALANYRAFPDTMEKSAARWRCRRGHVRHQDFAKDCEEFKAFFLWHDGRLAHFCAGRDCCPDMEHFRKTAVSLIVKVLYQCLPCTLSKGKWTRTGPCLDFHLVSQGFSVLQKQYPLAFQGLKVTTSKSYDDFTIIEELSWHKVAGARMANGLEVIKDPRPVPLETEQYVFVL